MPVTDRLRFLADSASGRLDALTRAAGWLVLPLAQLLFAQWPLRDVVGAGSRQANDIAQWLFALYVAAAVRAATRQRAHVAAAPFRPGRERGPVGHLVERCGEAACVLPWALFVLVDAARPTWGSVVALEAFPDTFNPLYFVVRVGAWLLALLVAAQAVLDLAGSGRPMPSEEPHP